MSGGGGGSTASTGGGAINGVPDWAAFFVPENAKVIAYANVDKLLSSASEFQKLTDRGTLPMPGDFVISDVNDVFVAGCSFGPGGDEPMVVLRMKSDRPLKDMLPKALRDSQPKSLKNVEYVGLKTATGGKEMLMAKVGECTFCYAPGEDMLSQALERKERNQRANLDKNLQAVLDAVASGNMYIAGIGLTEAKTPAPINSFSVGVWLTSSIEIQASADFTGANEAEKCKKEIKEKIDGSLPTLRMVIPAEQMKDIEKLISAIDIRQDGNKLNCRAKWEIKDLVDLAIKLKDLANKLKGGQSPFPGQPGAVPPGAFPRPPGAGPPAHFPCMPGR